MPVSKIQTPFGTKRGREPAAASGELNFATLYDEWFERVVVWLVAFGAPTADREDLAQEVFLVVRRRLPDFDGRNVAGWLFQIARRQVLRHKRLVWVRRVFPFSGKELRVEAREPQTTPLAALQAKESRQLVEALLAGMTEKRRVVFALFELEGYAGEEIAGLLDVPVNTVWTRLHHARRDFFKALAEHERAEREDR